MISRRVEGYWSSVTYAATPPTADVVARAFGCAGGRVLVGLDERLDHGSCGGGTVR